MSPAPGQNLYSEDVMDPSQLNNTNLKTTRLRTIVLLDQTLQYAHKLLDTAQKRRMAAGNVFHRPGVISDRFDHGILQMCWHRYVLGGHNVCLWYIQVPAGT